MRLPDPPATGSPIAASWGKAVIDYIRSITPRTSPDCLIATGPNGTTFQPTIKSRGQQASAVTFTPFQLIVTGTPGSTDPTSKQITINSGVVNNSCPRFQEKPLWMLPPPSSSFTSGGTDGIGFFLKAVIAAGLITALTVESTSVSDSADSFVPDDTSTKTYYAIGMVRSDGSIVQLLNHNLRYGAGSQYWSGSADVILHEWQIV